MTALRSVLVAALAALALAAPAQDAAQGPTPSEVVDAFHEALKTGDRRKALEQLTADVLIFEQGRVERSRSEYARTHLGEDISFAAVTERTVSRRAVKIAADVAWVTSVNRTRGSFKGRSVDFVTDETMILTHVGGKWRIVHIHWSFDNKAVH